MSNIKSSYQCHIMWSRNHNERFIAVSSDVKLFELSSSQYPGQSPIAAALAIPQSFKTSLQQKPSNLEHPNSKLIATGPEIPSFKAASCYLGSLTDDSSLVGISCGGMTNLGKIVLVSLRPAANHSIDNSTYIDLTARRTICNDIDWAHVNPTLIASGWEKQTRVDNSLQIWDVSRIIDTGKYSFNFAMSPNNRPVFEFCPGDSIYSLKWFRKEQSLICGVNNKNLRIFDLRDPGKAKLITATRAVYGLDVDSFSDRRIASFVDNQIFIWDIRGLEKPLVSIVESKPVSQIQWCPTRNHSFSALMSGDDCVKIYDIQQASLFSDDFEAKIVDRSIHPFVTSHSSTYQQLASYDWHPIDELRMIAISNSRDVRALTISDRITLNWSPICEIVWTKGKKILQCLDSRDERYKSLDDISVNMRHRAITNYGMIVEEGPHHQRGDDSDLIGLLRWVKLAKSLEDTMSSAYKSSNSFGAPVLAPPKSIDSSKHRQSTEIMGVGSLLRDISNCAPSRAEIRAINWSGMQASSSSYLVAPVKIQVYHSELRSRALLLCDWIPDIDNIGQQIPIIDYLEHEGNYMRAASIAVFNMRLQRAIESLTVGASQRDSNLSSVAMALSGYTGERNSVWREMCQSLRLQLRDPYMKAMFAFLTSESEADFDEIIYDKDLILADRVAFALLYLPDDRLNEYLKSTMDTLVANGDLNGILLTGITNDGLDLLQRYIETSSDIQSVSLIVLHSLPSAICNDERAQLWVECYRGMLDCWRLWHQRAMFDNLWYSQSPNSVKPANHILISCNYCGNSIAKQQQQNQQQQQQHQQQQSTLVVSSSAASTTSSSMSLSTVTGAANSAGSTTGTDLNASIDSSLATPPARTPLIGPANSTITGSTPMSGPGARNKAAGCSSCRKCSFAKCCLCLTQLGTNTVMDQRYQATSRPSIPTPKRGTDLNSRTAADKTNPFANWFSWCQTCRHGAHSAHLLSWFNENSECPVSGCDCKCMNLDSRTKLDVLQGM